MASHGKQAIKFGPFEVTNEVFHITPHCFALVNIKPLVPGHVLVIPHRHVKRFTDLTGEETSDIFVTVQKVQRMLAWIYFSPRSGTGRVSSSVPGQAEQQSLSVAQSLPLPLRGEPDDGSFNVALQDGEDAGQSVAHVHCHVIPRVRGNELGDAIYEQLEGEEGNVGGGLWDREIGRRPKAVEPGEGGFKIEESARKERASKVMNEEAAFFQRTLQELGLA